MVSPVKTIVGLVVLSIALMAGSKIAIAQESPIEFQEMMIKNKGNVIYVDFWASWCVPCRQSFLWMNTMQEKYQDQGLTILSINLDAQVSFAEAFLQESPASFPLIYDIKGKLAKQFKVQAMPSSYLFDRTGKLISKHRGFNTKKQELYQQEIEKALVQ